MRASVKKWLRGWVGASISAAASAVSTGLSGIALAPEHFNLSDGLLETLKLIVAGAVLNGILGAMLELKKSPLPPEEDGHA